MKNNIDPDTWSGWTLKGLKSFKSRRDSTSKATCSIINETMNSIISSDKDNFRSDFRMLEVGSGAGYSIGLFSRFSPDNDLLDRWIQSEPNPELANESERTYGKKVIVSSIQALPGILEGEKFPLVFGVNCLDTLIEPLKANQLESTINCLRGLIPPNGYFVHFMDLNPSYNVVKSMCNSYASAYPFPFYNKEMHSGVQFISKKDIRNLVKGKKGAADIKQLKTYLKNPLKNYIELVAFDSPKFRQLANLVDNLVAPYQLGVRKQITFIQYFERVAKRIFKPEDWLVSAQTGSGHVITDFEDRHKLYGIGTISGDKIEITNNTIINAFGFAVGFANDENVPHGKIREVTHMHILTAQKKDKHQHS